MLLSPRAVRLLALVPLAYVAVLIALLHVDVPWNDQWQLVPALGKYFDGELGFSDLWAQHNEHRLLVPKAIMLLLAAASRWNIALELAVILALAVATFAVVAVALRDLAARVGAGPASWEIPAASLLLFSLAQKENWLWGWQIQIVLNNLAVVAGLWMLARQRRRTLELGLAVVLGAVALFSFANGLLYWPIGACMLAADGPRDHAWWTRLVAWLACSAALVALFFHGYTSGAPHPLAAAASQPLRYLVWTLAWLGSPLAQLHWAVAAPIGLLGLALLATLTLALGRRVGWRALAFPLALSAWAVASALMTGLGRVAYGLESALWSRYTTFSSSLWLAVVCLVAWHLRLVPARRRWSAAAAIAVVVLALVSELRGTQYALFDQKVRLQAREACRDAIERTTDTLLPLDYLSRQRETLRRHRLSCFRGR